MSAIVSFEQFAKRDDPKPQAAKMSRPSKGTRINLPSKDPVAIADAFIKSHYTSDGMRTLHRWRQGWWSWDGCRYIGVEEDALRAKLWTFLADESVLLKQAGKGVVEEAPTSWHSKNVMEVLAGRAYLAAEVESPVWLAPSKIEGRPLLAVRNGILDLESGDLHPSTPAFFNTRAVNVKWAPGAQCPLWLAFLNSLWEGREDCDQYIQLEREKFGYLISHRNEYQKILVDIGPLRCGKGTKAAVARKLIGDAVVSLSLTDFDDRFGLEQIINKSVAIAADARFGTDAQKGAMAVERMLSISGGDSPSVNRKHRTVYAGETTVVFWILANGLPPLDDPSGALAGRFVPSRMFKSFYGREDTQLLEKLSLELEGVLVWAVEGWRRLRARGRFEVPDSAMAVVEDFGELSNPLSEFMSAAFVRDESSILAKEVVYKTYLEWMQANKPKRSPMDSPRFFAVLGQRPGIDTGYRYDEHTGKTTDADGKRMPRRVKGLRLRVALGCVCCPSCNAPNGEGRNNCIACGQSLDEGAAPTL